MSSEPNTTALAPAFPEPVPHLLSSNMSSEPITTARTPALLEPVPRTTNSVEVSYDRCKNVAQLIKEIKKEFPDTLGKKESAAISLHYHDGSVADPQTKMAVFMEKVDEKKVLAVTVADLVAPPAGNPSNLVPHPSTSSTCTKRKKFRGSEGHVQLKGIDLEDFYLPREELVTKLCDSLAENQFVIISAPCGMF